jgi:SSS family solute:Na+ symporter
MQVIIVYIGLVFIGLPIGIRETGGWSALWSKVPEAMRNIGGMGASEIVAMLLTTVLAVFVVQISYMLTISAKDPRVASKANTVAGLLYIVPGVCSVLVGVMAFVLFGNINPNAAMGAFMTQTLPIGFSGLLMAALIAATMSSSSTCGMAAALCFVKDIYQEFINPNVEDRQLLRVTQITLGGVIIVSLIIAMFFTNIVAIILWGYAIACGALLPATIAMLYWKRATNAGAVVSMLVGGSLHLCLTILGSPIPVIYISVPTAAVVLIIVSLATKQTKDMDEFYRITAKDYVPYTPSEKLRAV